MIDPLTVVSLDGLFSTWLQKYHNELLGIQTPTILVDASLPGYLELIDEMDMLAEHAGTPLLIQSFPPDEAALPDAEVVLCVTRRNSLLSTLAQVHIYQVVQSAGCHPDLGQVWEVAE